MVWARANGALGFYGQDVDALRQKVDELWHQRLREGLREWHSHHLHLREEHLHLLGLRERLLQQVPFQKWRLMFPLLHVAYESHIFSEPYDTMLHSA